MDKKFTIEWCEKKTTSTGKEKLDARLKDEQGNITDSVTIWSDFPDFANLMNGGEVTGSLNPAKDPKYGPTLYAPRTPKTPYGGPMRSPSAIATAMKTKEASIGKFQDAKEQSIKVASTFSGAWNMAVAEFTAQSRITTTGATLEQLFEKWRQYLWENFDCSDSNYPPKI